MAWAMRRRAGLSSALQMRMSQDARPLTADAVAIGPRLRCFGGDACTRSDWAKAAAGGIIPAYGVLGLVLRGEDHRWPDECHEIAVRF